MENVVDTVNKLYSLAKDLNQECDAQIEAMAVIVRGVVVGSMASYDERCKVEKMNGYLSKYQNELRYMAHAIYNAAAKADTGDAEIDGFLKTYICSTVTHINGVVDEHDIIDGNGYFIQNTWYHKIDDGVVLSSYSNEDVANQRIARMKAGVIGITGKINYLKEIVDANKYNEVAIRDVMIALRDHLVKPCNAFLNDVDQLASFAVINMYKRDKNRDRCYCALM